VISLRSTPVYLLALALLSIPAKPQTTQTQPDQPRNRIRVQVNEVELPVTVLDDKGRFVSNLKASDFRVLDEGKPQRIEFFSHDQKQPVVVGFLIDQSNGVKTHWDKYRDSLLELVWQLLPGDPRYSGYLISYSNEAELKVNTTSDSEKLASAIRKMKPGGGAALMDAIHIACTRRDLVKGEPYEPRRVLIILGDGRDTSTNHTLDEVIELAHRNQVTIYAVSTQAFGFVNESQTVIERLTTETGGHVEYPLNNPYKDISGYLSKPQDAGNYAIDVGTGGYAAQISAGIIKAVEGLSGEITTQYVIRYVPDIDPEAKPKIFRKIKVEVPALPELRIRARQGYYPEGLPIAPAANSQ
jgi:VWFA-related protein